jgi:hypothetical protein
VGCISNITGLAVDCSDPNGYLPDPYGISSSIDTPGVPTSTPTPAPSSSGSSGGGLLGLFSGLSNLAGSISNAIRVGSTPTFGSIASVASAQTPYPVVINGQTVGYSSVPQVPSTSGTLSLTGGSGIIVLIIAVIAVFALGRSRR